MLTLTDMFCGAGGSSTGALEVPGIEVRTAMNHWERAIETHNTNHPDTTHVMADISQVDPRYVRDSDILWASPECTNHSVAKGRRRVTNQPDLFGDGIADEAADRSRATMWDVPRFAEHHDYKLIITENVVDAARWVMFDAWLMAMSSLGYEHHIVYMNSMHAQLGGLPAPQSRDRMYVMFWKKGNPRPDFDRLRPLAYCPTCDETVRAMQVFKKADRWGRYRAQYNWRCPSTTCRNQIIEPGWLPAASAIDWSLPAQRIGDRTRPLAEKTMARIRAGLEKFGAQAMQLAAAGNTWDAAASGRGSYYRVWPTTDPLQNQTGTIQHGIVVDSVRGSNIVGHTGDPFSTQTTAYTRGLAVPPMMVPAGGTWHDEAHAATDPLRTITTREAHGVMLPPLLMRNNSSRGSGAEMTTSTDEVMRTLTTMGHQSLLMPYYGNGSAQRVTEPVGTLTTVDRYAMITLRGQNAPKSPRESMDTFAANGQHHAIASMDTPRVEDCGFRMLEPHEITAGMAFPKSYIMTGNKREQVKQAGNAVTPPAARDLITIGAESLGVAA